MIVTVELPELPWLTVTLVAASVNVPLPELVVPTATWTTPTEMAKLLEMPGKVATIWCVPAVEKDVW